MCKLPNIDVQDWCSRQSSNEKAYRLLFYPPDDPLDYQTLNDCTNAILLVEPELHIAFYSIDPQTQFLNVYVIISQNKHMHSLMNNRIQGTPINGFMGLQTLKQ